MVGEQRLVLAPRALEELGVTELISVSLCVGVWCV